MISRTFAMQETARERLLRTYDLSQTTQETYRGLFNDAALAYQSVDIASSAQATSSGSQAWHCGTASLSREALQSTCSCWTSDSPSQGRLTVTESTSFAELQCSW
jgi:hypothetical protein